MFLPARPIVEHFLRIVIRQPNHNYLGLVSSEARPARRSALPYLLQSRPLRPWTPGRRTLRSSLLRLFLHPMLAGLLAILDPLPPLPWMLLLCDDIAIRITALGPSTSPKHLSLPTLCCQSYQISFLLNFMPQYQQSIVISLPSSAWMGQRPLSWST